MMRPMIAMCPERVGHIASGLLRILREARMTYMGEPYYPLWLDNLADDVTLEGAAMNGSVHSPPGLSSRLPVMPPGRPATSW